MQTPFDFWNHWEKAYAHRLDWAYASRDRFLAEFDPAFRLALGDRQSAEAFAALYGDTQVGKTTLALKLMGIRPERFAELENILRAGRPRGQSSTATAIIYQRSADEHFRLITQAQSGDQPLDAAAFIQALQGMRQEIENHPDRRQTYRPGANFPLNISIKIPSVFFAESSDSTAINIVDLPGIGARSEAEHLKHILAHNLPLSTLIILVVKSENLTSLKYIQGDKIRHWRAMSQGFRIVTTHTLTNLKKHLPGFADKKALVDHVVQQCKASNEIGPDEELPRLYPLEYAESWERLVVQPSYERFQGILDELVNDLREDLKKHVTPQHKLLLLTGLQNVLKNELSEKLVQLEGAATAAQTTLEEAENRIGVHQSLLNRAEEKLEKKEGRYLAGRPVDLKYETPYCGNLVNQSEYEDFARKQTDKIKSMARDLIRQLEEKTKLSLEVEESVKAITRSTKDYLLGYCEGFLKIDRLFGGQKNRRENFKTYLDSCSGQVEAAIQEVLQEKIKKYNRRLEKEMEAEEEAIGKLHKRLKSLQAMAQTARNDRAAGIRQCAEQRSHNDRQLALSGNFDRYLAEDWRKYHQTLESSWQQQKDPEAGLAFLLEQVLLLEEFQDLSRIKIF